MDVTIDYHVWDTILEHYQRRMPKLANIMPRKKTFCRRYRMICFTSLSIRQLYHLATDFDRVLLQLVGTDIENSLFKYVIYEHTTFMIKAFQLLMKSCEKLICYSCIFHVQLHVHLKKWTLKFQLLYLRNYISYFNKICRICWVNILIQSLKVWRKFVLPWLNYSIFARGLFLLMHPVYNFCTHICSSSQQMALCSFNSFQLSATVNLCNINWYQGWYW